MVDGCLSEDASFFDQDGDGCIDIISGARHTEFWAPGDFPVNYVVNGPSYITDSSDTTAIQNAMSAWTAVSGTNFSAGFSGTSQLADAAALDRVNLVTFEDSEFQFGSSVLAVGITTSFINATTYEGQTYRPGQIVDSDIIFNPNKIFTTPTSGGVGTDMQSVATHEAGHVFGLAHSAVRTSTMFFVLPPGGDGSSLSSEDEIAIRNTYPDGPTVAGNRIAGTVVDSVAGTPVPGAIVFVIDTTSADTVGCNYTMPDGGFVFAGIPDGDYFVAIHPMNGTAAVGGLIPPFVNALVGSTAVTLFEPEYWNSSDGAAGDTQTAKDPVHLFGGSQVLNIDIQLNIDTDAPTVVSVSPDSNATDVRIDAPIVITFSEAMEFDSVSTNFSLVEAPSGPGVSGVAISFKDDSVLSFVPDGTLKFGTQYKLTLGAGMADQVGNTIGAPFVYSFTTETQPALSVTGLVPNKGAVQTVVTINGTGFDTTATNNTVEFDGTAAVVADASHDRLVVTVPQAATTGLVHVIVGGDTSTGLTYTVVSPTEVARGFGTREVDLGALPRSIATMPDGSYAFAATDAGVSAIVVHPDSSNYLAHTAIVVAGGLNDVAVTPDGKFVFGVSSANNKLYRIDPTTLSVVGERGTIDEPRGLVIGPTGRKAFVATDAGEFQVWDVDFASPTFNQQIGVIASPDANIRGRMAVTPGADTLLALTGTGKLLVFDIGSGAVAAEIEVGEDPRDIVIDPHGDLAYVTDDNGIVCVVSLGLLQKVDDIDVGGTPRGLTITPGANFLHVANRELNIISLIDLRSESASFWSVAASIPQGMNPVDVVLDADALRDFSIIEAENKFVITTVGLGPTLASLSLEAGAVGSQVVIAGTDFGADTSQIRVLFGDQAVGVDAGGDSAVTVTVPAGAESGTVRVQVGAGMSAELTNSIFFDVLPATPSPGLLRSAAQSYLGVAFQDRTVAARSPQGDQLVAAGSGGRVQFIDTDPSSSTVNEIIHTTSLAADSIWDIQVTPDGKRAYVAATTGGFSSVELYEINSNRNSVDYGDTTSVDFGSFLSPVSLRDIAISPDGWSMAVKSALGVGRLYFVDIAEGSPTENQAVDTLHTSSITDMVFHPDGESVYMGVFLAPSVDVIDMRPTSGTFRQVVATVPMPTNGSFSSPLIHSMAFLPDGLSCLVLVVDSGNTNGGVVTLDTTNPFAPVAADLDGFAVGADSNPFAGGSAVSVSPRGDRAALSFGGAGLFNLDVTGLPYSSLNAFLNPANLGTTDHVFTQDGLGLYSVSSVGDSLSVYDFTDAQVIGAASANNDSLAGVINETLPSPLKVIVTDSFVEPVEGVAVTFKVLQGGGVFPENGQSTRVVITGSNGIAQTKWTLGAVADPDSQIVTASVAGLTGSPVRFRAHAFPDPNTIPIGLIGLDPADAITNVGITTAVQASFNRSVNPTTVNDTTFYMHRSGGSTRIEATLGFADENRKLSLTPVQALDFNTTYVVEITTDLEDDMGGTLAAPLSPTFDTETASPPLELSSVQPTSAPKGVEIVLAGTGFDPLVSNTKILFGDIAATPLDAGVDFARVVVPPDAATGSIRVCVGADTSNALDFTVLIPSLVSADDVIGNLSPGAVTRGIAITPDGGLAYAVSPNSGAVIPIDVQGLGTTQYPSIPVGDQPTSIVIHPENNFAYVANYGSGSVSIIDLVTNIVVQTALVGARPVDLAVSPDGDRLYVANRGSGTISEIDTDVLSETHHSVIANLSTGAVTRSIAITPDGGRLYAGTNQGYVVIDVTSRTVIGNLSLGAATRSISITPDGGLAILLTTEGDVLLVDINPGSPTEDIVIGSLSPGTGTRSVAITPDGGLLYLIQDEGDVTFIVSINVLNAVSVLEPGHEVLGTQVEVAFVDTLSEGEDPASVAFDPTGSGVAVLTSPGDTNVVFLRATGLPTGVGMGDIAFYATSEARAALLQWTTGEERQIAGFHVARSDAEDGPYDRLTKELITAKGGLIGSDYRFRDTGALPNRKHYYKIEAISHEGESFFFGPYEFVYRVRFALDQNYPNPFNPVTRIRFTIPQSAHVNLVVYDVAGRRVRTLVNGPKQANHYEIKWDGKNDRGRPVASGVYFYKLQSGAFEKTRKMVVLK